MNEVVFKTLKDKDFIVKNYIIKVATELHLSLNELILLIYFTNQEEPTLNVANIMANVYLSEEEIMEAFTRLMAIELIDVSVIKNPNGVRTEIISLDNLLKQVTTDITKKHKREEKTNIFEMFEREFGRPLSPMEFEIINGWLEEGTTRELIIEALREAIYNGAKSLRYVSKILLSWKEKGYQTKGDISNKLQKETEENPTQELFDYNWLDED